MNEAADRGGELSEESGKVVIERVNLFLQKHDPEDPNRRKRGHLRVAFRRYVTTLQKHFFNNRVPIWTGSVL